MVSVEITKQGLQMVETCCSSGTVLLFPCSGGSNVGQIANQVGVKLTVNGSGSMYCLAGIGARDEGMILSTLEASRVVAIDGCPVLCSKRALEAAGITVTDSFVLTELGISKNKNYSLKDEDINYIYQQIKTVL